MSVESVYNDEYFNIIESLEGDIEGRRHARKYMINSSAIVHHEVVASSFMPKLFGQEALNSMKRGAEMAHTILCKVIQRYLDDVEYRSLFDFDDRLKDLILLPRGYDALLPFARVDTFLNEKDYSLKFCEFNADGSAGMNENREITNSILGSESFKRFRDEHDILGCDLFEPWIDEFISIYTTFENKVSDPTFAICDYLDHGVVDEFYVYAELFEKRGIHCIVCDVRDLKYDGQFLRNSSGEIINAIWRRCVTNDVIEFWDETQALIEAIRNGCVALIGSFAGHIVHDKQIFNVLLKPESLSLLTDEEATFLKESIPATYFLDDECIETNNLKHNKDEWIIKPADHYGADDVYSGKECSQEKWTKLLQTFSNEKSGVTFLAQKFIEPYKSLTLPPDADILDIPDCKVKTEAVPYNNLNGLYLYNGHFQGVFSRLGPNPTISKQNEGMTAATLWVDTDYERALKLDLSAKN